MKNDEIASVASLSSQGGERVIQWKSPLENSFLSTSNIKKVVTRKIQNKSSSDPISNLEEKVPIIKKYQTPILKFSSIEENETEEVLQDDEIVNEEKEVVVYRKDVLPPLLTGGYTFDMISRTPFQLNFEKRKPTYLNESEIHFKTRIPTKNVQVLGTSTSKDFKKNYQTNDVDEEIQEEKKFRPQKFDPILNLNSSEDENLYSGLASRYKKIDIHNAKFNSSDSESNMIEVSTFSDVEQKENQIDSNQN